MSETPIVPAFLSIPLDTHTTPLVVSQGWYYNDQEKNIHPDISTHFGVDFALPWDTPVYAPADGLAVASYHTNDILDVFGRTIGFGLGLFIQIWHEESQVYSLYAHLSRVNKMFVPYMPPNLEEGSWQPRKALYIPIDKIMRNAHRVHRGDYIGNIGYSGLRLSYEETPSNPATIDPTKDVSWDPAGPHLHWEVYTRTPDGSSKDLRYDPFGLYAEADAYTDVFTKANGLILAAPDGSPLFAR